MVVRPNSWASVAGRITSSNIAAMIAANSSEKDGLVSDHTTATIHAAHKIASQESPTEDETCTIAIAVATMTATQKPAIQRVIRFAPPGEGRGGHGRSRGRSAREKSVPRRGSDRGVLRPGSLRVRARAASGPA